MKRYWLLIGLWIAAPALAADGKDILEQQCASCHALRGPAAQTVAELWQRKGPDLFYAGIKYKRDWLESWLIKPQRLRPAGYLYFQHIKPGDKQDVPDTQTLTPHPALAASDAKAASDALLELKPPALSALVTAGDFKGGDISLSSGEMVFDKFNGCLACHQIEHDFGGLSGPEVYTGAKRMQEDYLVSFIRNPQAWNPKIPMPNKHTAEPNIQKIVQYLVALARGAADEK